MILSGVADFALFYMEFNLLVIAPLLMKHNSQRFGKPFYECLLHVCQRNISAELPCDRSDHVTTAVAGNDLGLERGIVANEDRTVLEKGAGQSALGAADDLSVVHEELIPGRGGKARGIFCVLFYERGVAAGTRDHLGGDAEVAEPLQKTGGDDLVGAVDIRGKQGLVRARNDAVREFLVMENRPSAGDAPHDVDAPSATGFDIHCCPDLLEPADRNGRRVPGVETERWCGFACLCPREQLFINGHVVCADIGAGIK